MALRDDFRFPEVFTKMDKYGWLNGSNFIGRDNFDMRGYLWFNEIKWLTCDKIINYEYDEYQSNSIVPFGFSAGGDIWGWHLDYTPDMPVVFCPHEDAEGVFYAPSFEGALFRQILDFASQNNFCINEGKRWEMNLEAARRHLLNWKNKLGKWLNKEWVAEIDRLMGLELTYYEVVTPTVVSGYYVLITPEENLNLTKKYLEFDLLDKTFVWVNEE